MKKFISILLALCICFSMSVVAFAEYPNYNGYPVIIVPGYSASQLVRTNDDGSKEKIWYQDFSDVLEDVKKQIPQIALGATLLNVDDGNYIASIVAPELIKYLEPLTCLDDGSSKYNIEPLLTLDAASSRWTEISDDDHSLIGSLEPVMNMDDVFMFSCDWRMDAVDNAKRLDKFVDNVLSYTGKEKVNLLSQSYGGQVVGTYLSLEPENVGKKVANAVMTVPALGGASLAYDFFNDSLEFDEAGVVEFIEYGFKNETDFHLLLKSNPDVLLDPLVHAVMPTLREIGGNWLSLWDFVPYANYKEVINQLDPVKNAEIIKKTTYFHEEIMAKYAENFKKAQNSGVNISILAGCGIKALSGSNENSDGIIPVVGSTGATVAPFDSRFSDGYSQIGNVCNDPNHNHISPSMEIDASSAYIPETTWIINGYFHGMDIIDDFSAELFRRQLLSSHPLQSVYEDKQFPQFHSVSSPAVVVHAKFNNSLEGYVSSKDTALIVKNNSKSTIAVTSISCSGMKLNFPSFIIIPSGEEKEIEFSGEIPNVSKTTAQICVSYAILGTSSFTPIGQRNFSFFIDNGSSVEYDVQNPYSPVSQSYAIDGKISNSANSALERLGLKEPASAIYNLIAAIRNIIRSIINFFKAI